MGTKFSPTARELTAHKVNGLNEAIRIFVLDKPGHGNACHEYVVLIPYGGDYVGGINNRLDDGWEDPITTEHHEPEYHELQNEEGVLILLDETRIAAIDSKFGNSRKLYHAQRISFQNGPIKENGYNGNSQEALIAILIDRLEGFQTGPFKCHDNQMALDALQTARLWLHKRTMDRVARGVEGTTVK